MNPLMKYAIFPDFYGADTKDWLSLNCELCTKAESRDFKQLFKAQPKTITNIIEFILKLKLEDFQFSQAINYFKSLENYAAANLFKQLLEKDNEQMIALKSLIEFYRKNGQDELLLGDIEEIENWGLTIRNGQKVLIIIDVGFKSLQNDIYKKIFGKTAEVKENILPDILAAGLVLEKTCEVLEHFTSAPKQFTDSSLISAMERAGNEDYEDDTAEKKGIGTSATRAGIIEHIIKNGYAERKSKILVPTEKGITLIKTVPEEIKSPKMTADWESKLQQIEKGNYTPNEFLKIIEKFVTQIVREYREKNGRIYKK